MEASLNDKFEIQKRQQCLSLFHKTNFLLPPTPQILG